ncbi:MAG: hypothetical protein JWM96_502 [Alphaproteobacteria bacterium]|nr:hypothetical protein [Alphaproteobacteria bacterium]
MTMENKPGSDDIRQSFISNADILNLDFRMLDESVPHERIEHRNLRGRMSRCGVKTPADVTVLFEKFNRAIGAPKNQ